MKLLQACRWLPASLASAASLGLAAPATAQLNIVIEFDSRSSDPPSWGDESGACLTSAVQAAADYWESIFPGVPATEIKFKYRWYNDSAHSHIGLSPLNWGEYGVWADTRRAGGAFTPNQYVCRFWTFTKDGETPWFVDADPTEHTEFDMSPRMYNWPSDAGTLLGISSVPAGDIEVGFEGAARANDVATTGCSQLAAAGGVDLFSVALHEIGHALGLGFRGEGDAHHDGDYDVWSPVHVGGIGLEARIEPDGDLDVSHLEAPYALMNWSMGKGVRRLPSMIDILAIASINGWTAFHLPRTYRKGTAGAIAWDVPAAWLDSVAPASNLGAVLYSGPADDVFLDASASADGVFVGSLSTLDVGPYALDAGERLRLDSDTTLTIVGGSVSCEALIHHGDLLDLAGGSVSVGEYIEAYDHAVINLATASLSAAGGAVRLRDQSILRAGWSSVQSEVLDLEGYFTRIEAGVTHFTGLVELVNDGSIVAANGDIDFTPAAAGVLFDLDGDQDVLGNPELGYIEAFGGSIVFGAPARDPFGGMIRLNYGHSVTVATSLPVDGGTIDFLGDNTHLYTGLLDMRGGVVEAIGPVGTDGFVHGQQSWWPGSSAYADDGNVLHLLGVSHYYGGTVSGGNGAVRQVGNAIVHPTPGTPTVLDVAHYIWDGEPTTGAPGGYPFSITTLLPAATLEIRGTVGVGVGDGYDGTVRVRTGATLILQQDWTLEGELVLEGGSVIGPGVITNAGFIHGSGNIGTTVINNGVIQCDAPPGLSWIGGALVPGTGTCEPGCEP